MSDLVLIADADSVRGRSIATSCSELGFETRVETHGAAALEVALAHHPSVLVVQLGLPLIDGGELGGILQTNPRTQAIRLLYVADTRAEAERGGLNGEIIPLPIDSEQVARKVRALIEESPSGRDAAAEPESDSPVVEGQLSRLMLADLLQLFYVSQKTGIFEIQRTEAESGQVMILGGDIVHASVGSLEGEKALYRLLAWGRGDFRFRQCPVRVEPTLGKPTRTLLREGMRQIAEWERHAASLPAMGAEVRLKIRRAALPVVIHPLTQEVLLVLETHSRVEDVVDHCSFPDYQVLRTLHTLVNRGVVEMRQEPTLGEAAPASGLFSAARGVRLREWLGFERSGTAHRKNADLLVVASAPTATQDFVRLLKGLPGFEVSDSAETGNLASCEVGRFARLAVDREVGIEFVQMPADPHFAPLWPVGGHGALGVLLLLSGPVAVALEAVRPVVEVLRRLPRSRIFHLLLVEKESGVEPNMLREHLSLFDESALFLVPLENGETAELLLREMFVRILP